ncbi:hypothetical protein [Bartonella sp. DGB2]|uniref:head-tail joining protein n=1 Tax=Bartonella sp. DGB2 TaxID=3388426 RepID=UPI00398FCB8D
MPFKKNIGRMLSSIFAHFGQNGTLIFSNQMSIQTLIIHQQQDKVSDLYESDIFSHCDLFKVRSDIVPSYVTLSFILLNDAHYKVQGEPIRDYAGAILKINAYRIESSS